MLGSLGDGDVAVVGVVCVTPPCDASLNVVVPSAVTMFPIEMSRFSITGLGDTVTGRSCEPETTNGDDVTPLSMTAELRTGDASPPATGLPRA